MKTQLRPLPSLSVDMISEAEAWLSVHGTEIPVGVAATLGFGIQTAALFGDPAAKIAAVVRQLHRALGITPSSERGKRSGKPLADVPKGGGQRRMDEKERLVQQIDRADRLRAWYRKLVRRRGDESKKLIERLMKLADENSEITAEEAAEMEAERQACDARLDLGQRCDLDCAKSSEKLMRGAGARLETLSVTLPVDRDSLPPGSVVKQQFFEDRERLSFSFSVTKLEIAVEKLAVQTKDGTTLVAASMDQVGPPKMRVTWDFLASMAILVSQYALPLSRFAGLASTEAKRFTGAEMSRYYRFTASKFVAVYKHLGLSLANADALLGDDTPSHVIEIVRSLAARAADKEAQIPWADYATAEKAKAALAKAPDASMALQLAATFGFEFDKKDAKGPKLGFNTSVLSGRLDAYDPKSTVIFYRSHLGGLGNLLDQILRHRRHDNPELVLQTDLSTVNLISEPALKERLNLKLAGCTYHARRPFSLHAKDDPEICAFILHHFKGIAIFETSLDVAGRNAANTVAIRQVDEKAAWEEILRGAKLLATRWARDTPLGGGARYVIRHYERLTYYLSDHRLEPSNNFSERMLRLERMIESAALFRQSLEGRFALDIMRSILQTAIVCGIDLEAYLLWVMRLPDDVVSAAPEEFTPHAFARWCAL